MNFHKELLDEIIQEWSSNQISYYIVQLEERARNLKEWIRHLKAIHKRKTRKKPLDTGVRGGI